MSYVVDLLNSKKEEYETLLNLVNNQFEKGNVFISEIEVDSAKKSKLHYEQVLADINEKIQLIKIKG
jgi:hypothetical protein